MHIGMKSLSVASFLVFFFVNSYSLASPTPNEFIRCKKMAVGTLAHCLNSSSYYAYFFCWKKSKKTYDSCSKKVFKSHNPDERKFLAETKKKLELEQKKLLHDSSKIQH